MMLSGSWTYRSYTNDPGLVGNDASAALALIFGEGLFEVEQADDGTLHGTLHMGPGYVLNLTGVYVPANPCTFLIVGIGLDDTATAGWRYDYHGVTSYAWPNGVDQVPSLLGTVIRVKEHGAHSPAGVTASFVAVRQTDMHFSDATPLSA